MGPLAAAFARHVLAALNINADDTPVRVLEPGSDKTKRGHLWAYVRDGRGWGERSVRGIGVGKKNYLFFGSDTGGKGAPIMYSITESCKLNKIDPQCYLQYVLERIAEHTINCIEELLPWNLGLQLNQPAHVTQALAA